MPAFDRMLAKRTLGFTAAMVAATWILVVLTDEAGSTSGMRLARVAALAPLLAGVGGVLSLSQASHRGELRALAALGSSPWRTGRGVMAAGWAVGGLALTALSLPMADIRALLPAVSPPASWLVDGRTFIEPHAGLRVLENGSFSIMGPLRGTPHLLGPQRSTALWAFGPMALLIPPWITAPISLKARLVAFFLSGGLTLVLLHLVAAGSAQATWLVLPSLPLAAQSFWGHVVRRWRPMPRLPHQP